MRGVTTGRGYDADDGRGLVLILGMGVPGKVTAEVFGQVSLDESRRRTIATRLVSALSVLAALAGVAVLVSVALVAIVHVGDTYHLDNVAGAWLELARYVNVGDLYPSLYDGSHYGGTRYMPLNILLYAGAGRIGDDITAAKVVALVVFALLLILVFRILRGFGCSRSVSVALAAAIPATFTGLFAATTVYGDTLPVLLQLAALALVSRTSGRRGLVSAAALCCLAFMTKLTALWAVAAIAAWLLLKREPRRLAFFVAVYAGLVIVSVGLFELLTHSRFVENVHGLALSGFIGPRGVVIDAPQKLSDFMRHDAQAALFLVPLALASMVVWLHRERRLSIYALGLVFSFLSLLVVLADHGTDFNHLLDLVVLISVSAGEFLAWAVDQQHARPWLLGGALLLMVAALGAVARPSDLRHDTRLAAERAVGKIGPDRAYARDLMAPYIAPRDKLLSEDPLIPFLLRRDPPTVLDAFMLLRIAKKHPTWRAALVERINRREFDKIVVMFTDLSNKKLWPLHHFGVPIASAIARNYRLSRSVVGDWWYHYYVYVPARASRPG
jgi:Glycosyltransferase family 87